MITETNIMGVPEVRNYQRTAIEGGIVIRYEVRQPGERDWTPVRLFQPTEELDSPRRPHFLEAVLLGSCLPLDSASGASGVRCKVSA